MPLHDWSQARPGWFHHFHNAWIYALAERLNAGLLPSGYYAAGEQIVAGREPDLLTFHTAESQHPDRRSTSADGAIAVAEAPPVVAHIHEAEEPVYVRKQDRLAVRTVDGDELVAILEIISPGNKDSRLRWQSFLDKIVLAVESGCHVLVIDLLPADSLQPRGVHAALWSELTGESLSSETGPQLIAYCAAARPKAFIQPLSAGDVLPDMPLFLDEGHYVNVPLEATYEHVWNVLPAPWKVRVGNDN